MLHMLEQTSLLIHILFFSTLVGIVGSLGVLDSHLYGF